MTARETLTVKNTIKSNRLVDPAKWVRVPDKASKSATAKTVTIATCGVRLFECTRPKVDGSKPWRDMP
jgi:hypothetical protein